MNVIIIDRPKQKTWGIITRKDGTFHTGFVGKGWVGSTHQESLAAKMQIGKNAIITGALHITSMSRGRSAANFHGYFADYPDVIYEMGMNSALAIMQGLQSGRLRIEQGATLGKGYIVGEWTFAKQGQDIFLRPNL